MNKNANTTCGRFLESLSPRQKKQFKKEHEAFLISEMLRAAMENDDVSVRKLAHLAGVSSAIIQGIRSGSRSNVTVKTLSKLMNVFGYTLVLKKGKEILPIDASRL